MSHRMTLGASEEATESRLMRLTKSDIIREYLALGRQYEARLSHIRVLRDRVFRMERERSEAFTKTFPSAMRSLDMEIHPGGAFSDTVRVTFRPSVWGFEMMMPVHEVPRMDRTGFERYLRAQLHDVINRMAHHHADEWVDQLMESFENGRHHK